jgi:hypothetical protein
MTRYCVDPVRHELIATWGTGQGELATRVAAVPSSTSLTALSHLAATLTHLSEAAWRTYTRPASAADSLETNSEGWRREQERKAFSDVAQAVSSPHLPSGGSITVSYSPLLESAHRVGRALVDLDNAELAEAVRNETAAELASVESAELGDLTGRAQQAVLLSREGASPVQVAAADRLFEVDPFGADSLFCDIDPTAAAVAAAHWLYAAAEAASQVSGHAPTEVVQEADNIEALAHETPTLVLELIEAGLSPYEAVTGLVRDALHVADGMLPDPVAFREKLDAAEELIAAYGSEEPQSDTQLTGIRLTPLDPQRPALDLLEDLLAGIHGCWLIHDEYAESFDDEDADQDDEDWDEERSERHQEDSREAFAVALRATAASTRDRLL